MTLEAPVAKDLRISAFMQLVRDLERIEIMPKIG